MSRRSVTLNLKVPRRWVPAVRLLSGSASRAVLVMVVLALLITEIIPLFEPGLAGRAYSLSEASSLLPASSQSMADKLRHDPKQGVYSFNAGYNPLAAQQGRDSSGGPHITALAHEDPAKGIEVTDPQNQLSISLKPKFGLLGGKKQSNRIVYPLADGSGWLVYTMQAAQAKEDIILRHAGGNTMRLKYELGVGDQFEARLLKSGAIAIYGSDFLSGNISTGSAKDAQLLQKARQRAAKNKLMFIIPAPVIKEFNTTRSDVSARYELKGSELTLKVAGLKKANYPLTIDPSVYVTSAQQFMQGNNESNIDFDTSNDLIQKSKLTGARIPSWTSDLALNASRWSAGYAVGGGYAYVVGGRSGGTATNTVYWAQFNPSDNTMRTPPNPGTGSNGCNSSSWCTNSAYNLPASRSGLSVVVYNGYIYAIGGTDSSCAGTNNVCDTVYYSKIGANGEPIGWNTTSTLVSSGAGNGRRFAGAAVYNNKIYVVGGQSDNTLNGETSVEAASVNPSGTLGTWSTTGMTAIPTAGRWGMTVLQNNGYLYLVGGSSTTTTAATVQYIKIKTDGTLDSWVTTSSFTNARATFGGNFATIYGNYMYITSGCATLTTTSCSTFTSTTNDFQLASLNADGSVTGFTAYATPLMSAASTAMTGYGLVAWRGALYGIGGCTAVSTATNCSGTSQTQVKYGAINSDGDASAIKTTNSIPATGTGASQGGTIANGVVVNNGYIYNVGGCAGGTGLCTTMSRNTSWAAIASDGSLTAPGTCGGTTVNTIWCNDSTNLLPAGIGAMGITVHNNVIYATGGFSGSADVSTTYRTALNTNGSISAWATDANGALATPAAYVFIFARAVPGSGTQSYMYQIGGCTGSTGIGCSAYVATVRRCTITNSTGAFVASSCTTTGQLQLFTGTGIFGGAVYGDYIYLAGGANSLSGSNTSPTGATCTADPNSCGGQMDIVQYAMVNTSGNITRNDGSTTTGGWHVASSRLTEERRRTTAFGINGYLYIVAGHNGGSPVHTLQDIQRGKIDVDTGDVTGFTALATTITDRWDLRAAQANGYIYIVGGCTTGAPPASCSAASGILEYVQIYNNWSGSPASYTSSANRPATDRYGAAATVLNGYLYLAGGCTSTADCSTSTTATMTTDVTFAPLNADGSIGTWVTNAAYALPTALGWGRLENVGGTLYFIGGQTGAGVAQSTVSYSTPNTSTGVPAAWATASNVLPQSRSRGNTAVYNGRIYYTGGMTGTGVGTDQTTVYYSPDLSAGGNITSAWTTNGTSFQLARTGHSALAYGNNLYILGGYDGTNYLLDVQFAPINANGSVGSWNNATSLPQLVRQGDAFATNGYIYVFGGRSAVTTCTNNTYTIPVNADGSLGVWSQTSVRYNTARFGVAAAYDNGRAYLLGGQCNSTLTGNDRAVYGTLQLQPQLANYSIMIDTDTDVFPSKYLINGLDNGIGAAWFLRYISSTNSTNSWGQSTNAGKVSLGTPGTYTPKDSGGSNTNFSRYHMLFLTIDDQQAFGFPEDITRGPNIYDVTLQFTSDPGKRLRNGKTFTGGVQQPLDTPF